MLRLSDGRPRGDGQRAPHDLRRLVDGRAACGELTALYAAFESGTPFAAAGTADPVRRFRRLATAVAARGQTPAAAGLLGQAACGRGAFGASARPPAAQHSHDPRGYPPVRPSAGNGRGPAGILPARGGHAVHDAAGRLRGLVAALQRPRRLCRRVARGQPRPAGNGSPDRLLRQRGGAAERLVGRSEFPRAAAAGAAGDAGRLRPPGDDLGPGGRGRQSAPRHEPPSPVPGHVCPAEHRTAATGHLRVEHVALGRRADAAVLVFRPDAGLLAKRRGLSRGIELQHRSVPGRNHRPHGPPLRGPPGRGRRRARSAAVRLAALGRGGTAAAPGRVEPDGGRLSPRGLHPRVVRLPGGANARGPGRGPGRTALDLPAS